MELFADPVGGKRLKQWVREVDNGLYGSLVFRGGKAFRDQISKDTNNDPEVYALLSKFNDEELAKVLSNLGGHCMEVRRNGETWCPFYFVLTVSHLLHRLNNQCRRCWKPLQPPHAQTRAPSLSVIPLRDGDCLSRAIATTTVGSTMKKF